MSSAVLEGFLGFMENLALPEPAGQIAVCLKDETKSGMEGRAPYYLILSADSARGQSSLLNLGYAAGQAISYLHFQGISSYILEEAPQWLIQQTGTDGDDTTVLAFGHMKSLTGERKSTQIKKETSCVYRDPGDHWRDEVLAHVRTQFPSDFRRVRIAAAEKQLYIAPRVSTGKKVAASAFATGMVLAHIMTAAEELWIDLEWIGKADLDIKTADESRECGIGICRKGDRADALAFYRAVNCKDGRSGHGAARKEKCWRYA